MECSVMSVFVEFGFLVVIQNEEDYENGGGA